MDRPEISNDRPTAATAPAEDRRVRRPPYRQRRRKYV